MKGKAFAGILVTLMLVSTMFYAFPVKAQFAGAIKIGIIGPVGLPHWDPSGMKPAAVRGAKSS